MNRLLIFGHGYCGAAIAAEARAAGFSAVATSRTGTPGCVPFDAAEAEIAQATHILTTAAPNAAPDAAHGATPDAAHGATPDAAHGATPDAAGDPVLARFAAALAACNARWFGYLSSTVVYGNRDGGWVDEDTPPAPTQARGVRRVAAEDAWAAFANKAALDIFRLAGIYGPGRSAFDDLRAGRARRMIKPGHLFGRIHRDDIARAVVTAMRQDRPPGRRILNLSDDEPSESAAVVTEAAALLGLNPPRDVAFAEALPSMSPMAQSFWAENRKVACQKTKNSLGLNWRYPTYREGLRAILIQERGDRPV